MPFCVMPMKISIPMPWKVSWGYGYDINSANQIHFHQETKLSIPLMNIYVVRTFPPHYVMHQCPIDHVMAAFKFLNFIDYTP